MKKHYASLAEALDENKLVVLYRKGIDDNRIDGYVVGLSDAWVLLHLIDGSVVIPNGYKAVRVADISRFQVDAGFVDEYLRLRGMHSTKMPQIELKDLASLLLSVSKHYPLFMIECERVEPGIGFVGQIEKLTKRSLLLKKINSKARWINTEEFKMKNITSVDFGDGYVEALAWMDAHYKEMEANE